MITIQRVLVKYGLVDIIKRTHLLRPLRFLFYLARGMRKRRDIPACGKDDSDMSCSLRKVLSLES